jgi:hypothetical protein
VQNASGNISANVSAEIEKPDSGLDNITLAEELTGIYSTYPPNERFAKKKL